MVRTSQEADPTPKPSTPQSLQAEPLEGEANRLQALCKRLETAAEALIRLRDRLQVRASEWRGCDEDRERDGTEAGGPDPDGGRL